MAKCKYCGDTIQWLYKFGQTPPGEKNVPHNMDGSPHNTTCKSLTSGQQTQQSPITTAKKMHVKEAAKVLYEYFLSTIDE